MQKITLLILMLFSGMCLKAQTTQPDRQAGLDSLNTVWQDKTQSDSLRVVAYKRYIWSGVLFKNPDSAYTLAEDLLAFAQKKQFLDAKGVAYHIQGVSFHLRGNFPLALDYYERSLKIREEIADKEGISDILNNIGMIYNDQGNYSQALDYYQRSLKINEEMENKGPIANVLINIGRIYQSQGNYPQALDYSQRSLKICEEIGYKKGIASVVNNIGIIYQRQGNYPQALDFFQRSLKIKEEIGNKYEMAISHNNIGLIYQSQGNYPQAMDYFQRSLKIREEIGDKKRIAVSLNNIGNIYNDQGNYPQAMDYYQRSLKIGEEIGNKDGIAISLNNIGKIYKSQDNYQLALDYYQRSLKIREEIGDKNGIAVSLNNIGQFYKDEGKYHVAITQCQRALKVSEDIGAIEHQKNACSCLYEANKGLGKGSKALVFLELMHMLEDSLNADETGKKLQQMEFAKQVLVDSIATAEKERMVQEAHEAEVRKKNETRNGLLIGGLFFVLLAGGFYSRWRFVKKANTAIEYEKDRSDNLLLNILPEEIAQELKEKGRADARDFEMVSILFSDFKEFTATSEKLSAQELVAEINICFEAFDHIMGKYNIEKIKTIGDAYMAAGGLPVPTVGSEKNTVLAALEMQSFISERKSEMDAKGLPAFEMRVGVHTGPVVAGIVGVKKFQYDIWGDTVNTASRMESSGSVGQVNISQDTYELLKVDSDFAFENRGKIEAKGKGELEMYFVRMTAGKE